MRFLVLILLLPLVSLFAQDDSTATRSIPIDSLYREDQIYIGVQYLLLNNRPSGVSNDNISLGFHFGFLRDFPVNKSRTLSIAPGIGYSFKNYNTSIVTSYDNNILEYSFQKDIDKNFIRFQYLDVPIEFRWRTSTPDSHKFWRWYTGVRLSYIYTDRSYYNDGFKWLEVKNNRDFNRIQTSLYTTLGWNTWNLYFSYGLNPIYNTNTSSLGKLNAIEVGLQFYIL